MVNLNYRTSTYFERLRANLLKIAKSSADALACRLQCIAGGFASESRSEAKMRVEGRALGRRWRFLGSVGSGCYNEPPASGVSVRSSAQLPNIPMEE